MQSKQNQKEMHVGKQMNAGKCWVGSVTQSAKSLKNQV